MRQMLLFEGSEMIRELNPSIDRCFWVYFVTGLLVGVGELQSVAICIKVDGFRI